MRTIEIVVGVKGETSACFTGLWVRSFEHDEALAEIAGMCRGQNWRLAVWDIERGLQVSGQADGQPAEAGGGDPLAAIRSLNALASADSTAILAILVLINFHRFLSSAEVVQALVQQIGSGKASRAFVTILSPVIEIPVELEKLMVVVEHELPGRDQLESIARGIATENGELPEGDGLETVLEAAAGLTRYEAEGAFSLSVVRHAAVRPEAVWELKVGMLKKSGLLRLHRGGETFADLGGLEAVKDFCRRALRADRPAGIKPRGIMLLGVPGSGKSCFARALGNETGRPTLILDPRSLYGSLLGQTEQNLRQALRIADAMGGILYVDEIRDALAGGESSGRTDGGVTAGVLGTLQTWLADHASDVFFVGSCNSLQGLPPQFTRAGRFNATFFFDYPNAAQRAKIWPIYLRKFGLDPRQPQPPDRRWTGAEVRQCCETAALLGLSLVDAARYVIPVCVSGAEENERLRRWAEGRCLSADAPGGIYRAESSGGVTVKPGRKVLREPSNN